VCRLFLYGHRFDPYDDDSKSNCHTPLPKSSPDFEDVRLGGFAEATQSEMLSSVLTARL
jgi:hypothetical protein